MLAAPGDAGNRPMHGRDAEGHLVVPYDRCAFEVSRTWEQLGNNCARIPGKTRNEGQPENKTSQQHREPGPACKPPSPVQIRAAPPKSLTVDSDVELGDPTPLDCEALAEDESDVEGWLACSLKPGKPTTRTVHRCGRGPSTGYGRAIANACTILAGASERTQAMFQNPCMLMAHARR
jgi:hypothetical protein